MSADPTPEQILNDVRADIDRIDAAMHALLIERSGVIEQLIAVKTRQGGGSAFRPGREAEMMRRLAERHEGVLPLDTVESIWRVIISTFTFVQAPYAVHADMRGGDAPMRDSARFHFGFTVPLHACRDGRSVVAAVAEATGDLGLVPVSAVTPPHSSPWWNLLIGADAPKVIARLPFVERSDHPAGLPVFVIARPSAAAAVRDIVLFAVGGPGLDELPFEHLGAERIASTHGNHLMAVATGADSFAARIGAANSAWHAVEVGGHAARHTVETGSSTSR